MILIALFYTAGLNLYALGGVVGIVAVFVSSPGQASSVVRELCGA